MSQKDLSCAVDYPMEGLDVLLSFSPIRLHDLVLLLELILAILEHAHLLGAPNLADPNIL